MILRCSKLKAPIFHFSSIFLHSATIASLSFFCIFFQFLGDRSFPQIEVPALPELGSPAGVLSPATVRSGVAVGHCFSSVSVEARRGRYRDSWLWELARQWPVEGGWRLASGSGGDKRIGAGRTGSEACSPRPAGGMLTWPAPSVRPPVSAPSVAVAVAVRVPEGSAQQVSRRTGGSTV